MLYKELENKIAVITGGSKEIGTAISKRFGEEKMKVVVNYNSDSKGAEETVEIIKAAGGDAVAVQANVGSEEGINLLIDTDIKTFGR